MNISIVLAKMKNTEGGNTVFRTQPMNRTINQWKFNLLHQGFKWLCALGCCLSLPPSVLSQDFSFLPDSTKQALATLPESVHDSIYQSLGAILYSRYTDEGYSQALDCFKKALTWQF
jgi:hypothetical protein